MKLECTLTEEMRFQEKMGFHNRGAHALFCAMFFQFHLNLHMKQSLLILASLRKIMHLS